MNNICYTRKQLYNLFDYKNKKSRNRIQKMIIVTPYLQLKLWLLTFHCFMIWDALTFPNFPKLTDSFLARICWSPLLPKKCCRQNFWFFKVKLLKRVSVFLLCKNKLFTKWYFVLNFIRGQYDWKTVFQHFYEKY